MNENDPPESCTGYCQRCHRMHTLPQGNARKKAVELKDYLEKKKSLLFPTDNQTGKALFSTTPLFQESRGKMFGVLECLTEDGSQVWLYAFSGQFNGHWHIPGWSPPLFNVEHFRTMNDPVERQIKEMGVQMESLSVGSEAHFCLQQRRRSLARQLMKDIHTLYRLNNFCGKKQGLLSVIDTGGGIPTGTGDCCAPKLLNQAAVRGLVPLSLAEFYFGRENRSRTKEHGHFYAPCQNKCAPLLGFLLCGAAEKRERYGS